MASDIFIKILEHKIHDFAKSFGDDANSIFRRDDKIFHPLEYGMYKERCAREILSFVSQKSVGISDGFLLTADNSISTQCDIIVYQNDTLPLIDNGIANFFPIEMVYGIGEIKSTLNKSQFKDALIKLANNKKLCTKREGIIVSGDQIFEEYKEMFSFLICNKLDFDIESVNFDEIYSEIPEINHRHNIILSLQDGIFYHELDFRNLPPKQKEDFKKHKGIDVRPITWTHPHHTYGGEQYKCESAFDRLKEDNIYEHIIDFLIQFKFVLDVSCKYHFDMIPYVKKNPINKLFEE